MTTKTYTATDCICTPSCAEADCAHCPYCCQEYAASHDDSPAPEHTYALEREQGDVVLWKRDDGKGFAARATNWRNARRAFARLLEEEDTRIDAAMAEKKEITLASADFQPGRWHWLRTPRCYCICSKCAEEWANNPTRDTSMAPMAGAVAKGLKCVHCGRRKS